MAASAITVVGEFAYVELTKGYFSKIDAKNVSLINGVRWSALEKRRVDGSIAVVYAKGRIAGKEIRMHRLITSAPVGFEVDHKDCNGLNNTETNLRIATSAQNQHNQRISIMNTSGVKGVSIHKMTGRYQVRIRVMKKQMHIGLYDSLIEAADAYKEASKKYHGEFGRLA